jgi:hypothetical protein
MKKETLMNSVVQGLMMAAIVAVAVPFPDMAFAQDLGANVTKTVGTELVNVPNLINAVFYIGGAALSGTGLMKLRDYSNNPGQHKLGEGVGRLAAGGAMLALPLATNTIISSMALGSATTYTQFNPIN